MSRRWQRVTISPECAKQRYQVPTKGRHPPPAMGWGRRPCGIAAGVAPSADGAMDDWGIRAVRGAGISPAAAGDQRPCLWTPRFFEKNRVKLLSFLFIALPFLDFKRIWRGRSGLSARTSPAAPWGGSSGTPESVRSPYPAEWPPVPRFPHPRHRFAAQSCDRHRQYSE